MEVVVPELTIEQRAALQMIAGAPFGLAVPVLRARGFSATLMIELVSSGNANWRHQA
jgi:hypothetical protein